ncbi:MAG: hypothetical protein JNL14_14495 [Devosia sp.]|uniref:2-keto-4-pentenoate hydratase n=1 Tax=Devosia sp. TaxID=1871048 RepID=UPI001A5F6292|nr:hypothetical protein [Devosia sp.]MBL8598941.1 hypothetical protein [Devosia sp.]
MLQMKAMSDAWEAHAAEIAAARLSPGLLDEDRIASALDSEAAAYALQRRVSDILSAELGPVVGYKIGMADREQQRKFGISEPLFGAMHAAGQFVDQPLRVDASGPPIGLECEIAVTLGANLPAVGAPYDSEAVRNAVATTHAAIEIVQSRFTLLSGTRAWPLVADAVLHRGFVLSEGSATPLGDGTPITGSIWLGGKILAEGTSRSLHGGGPLEALTWLVNKRVSLGLSMAVGDVVLCGSLIPVQWLDPASLGKGETAAGADFAGALPKTMLKISHSPVP